MRRDVRLPLEQLAAYLLSGSNPPAPVDWRKVFGNTRAVEMEIGFGKGLFLLDAATARPDVNFLGVEIERKYQLFTANRVAKRGLANVRLVAADARAFLRDAIPANTAQAMHVYFPDPWWKRRHHKRRLWTPEFAGQCQRVLQPGGRLHVATDVAEYFTVIQALLAQQALLRQLPPPERREPEHDLGFLTNFERKSRQQGKAVYRSLHEKTRTPT